MDPALQEGYICFYYSGHDAGNPIDDTNWPAYWCAINNTAKEGYVTCVNQ